MYEVVSVGKLSETQKSKLRNGHPVRVKKGSGNKLSLSHEQIKKLESAARKGKAVTITLDPYQIESHGSGIFGDITTKLKKLAVQNKDLINPIIGRVRGTAKRGVSKLANKANETIDKYITDIEGGALYPAGAGLGGGALYPAGYTGNGLKKKRGRPKKGQGIIGDVLKNVIGMTGLGVKPKTLKDVLEKSEPKKRGRKKKGEGIGALAKLAAKALAPISIDAASNFAKDKVSGMGVKKKRGRKPGKVTTGQLLGIAKQLKKMGEKKEDKVSGTGAKKKERANKSRQVLGLAKHTKNMNKLKKKGGKLEPMLYNVGPAKSQ
jgi:hypothetical protein